MFKKILFTLILSVITSSFAYASGYIGLSSGVVVNTSDTSNYRGVPLNVFGGYGADVGSSFYLGGELFITPLTGELSTSSVGNLRTTYGYGISFVPGMQFSEHTMGYARLGLIRTRFDGLNDNANGAQFGLGIETNLTPHWNVRGEYAVTSYSEIQGNSSLRADQFNLGVLYRFL